jgi:hypothetical protein
MLEEAKGVVSLGMDHLNQGGKFLVTLEEEVKDGFRGDSVGTGLSKQRAHSFFFFFCGTGV